MCALRHSLVGKKKLDIQYVTYVMLPMFHWPFLLFYSSQRSTESKRWRLVSILHGRCVATSARKVCVRTGLLTWLACCGLQITFNRHCQLMSNCSVYALIMQKLCSSSCQKSAAFALFDATTFFVRIAKVLRLSMLLCSWALFEQTWWIFLFWLLNMWLGANDPSLF